MFIQTGFFLAILQLTVGHPSSHVRRYDGHKVFDVIHKVEEDFLKILAMETKYELDFWKLPKHINDKMTIMVAPQYLEDFLHELEAINADVTTLIEDVEQSLAEHKVDHGVHRRSSSNSGLLLNEYNTYADIQNHLISLTTDSLKGVNAQVLHLGKSFENRDVDMIKLAFNPDNDTGIDFVLDNYDVLLAPVINPDGYVYTSTERLWRKNRRTNAGSTCYGVDLNRNFPFQWDPTIGGSTNPCSDLYSGTGPKSEPETQNIVNYLNNNGDSISAYLTVHSYGQMWLYPWGYTSAYPADRDDLEKAALDGTNELYLLHGTPYIVGSSTNELYAAAGGSDDFAKGGAGIKFSYTIELRDTGRFGFQLPKRYIEPTAKEFIKGFLASVRTMTSIYNNNNN